MPRPGHSETDHPRDAAMSHGVLAVGFAVATGFVASYLPWPWVFDIHSPDFNPMVALPLLSAGVTALETVRAVRAELRHRRFGAATLDLEGSGRLRLGQRVGGVVRTARPLAPTGPYRIRLRCVDTHEFRDTSENATSPRRNSDFVVWEREQECPAEAVDSTRGIPFAFRLPNSVGPAPQPPIRPTRSPYFSFKAAIMILGLRRVWSSNDPPVARRWLLEVSAPMQGTDFEARFLLPVDPD
ncbi:hypothetical protein DFH01_27040 [Falsiroseomonas bella]|uniref:Uncharacterized protein n=1 Tax=Falsiroseomonas bella TaxID=2184016 RepID=A0A317F8T7_9PROT|nr:hypothetical protein [Falsiroseomonas bella]PWS33996.1 hypothetical protein DFH01_27040 [Falsiroseomonas bella]